MPIGNITQTISELPAPPHRGVEVQTQFVIKQEDFQDHLAETTIDELNTLKDQLNTRIGEINSTVTTMNGYADTASAGASTATTKAEEASTSASGALTSKNQAETFKNNASASATKASQWADNNYNVAVETGKYSAKHWSTVAQNATSGKMDKVTSTDNAIVRFDGTTGDVQDSSVTVSDNGNITSNISTSGEHIFKPSTTAQYTRISVTSSDFSSLPSWSSTFIEHNGSTVAGDFITGIPNAGLSKIWGQNVRNMIIGNNSAPLIFVNGISEKMRIDHDGNVGIGTSSPANSKFSRTFTTQTRGVGSVAITAGDYSAGVANILTAVESLGARSDENTTSGGRYGAAFRRCDGTAISASTTLGYYAFGGQWGTDVGYTPSKHLYAASIAGVSEDNFTSATAMPTGISFRTGSAGQSLAEVNTTYGTERMRIDSNGNVLVTGSGGLGYGAGSGVTVVQSSTNGKSTTVTLNKPTGVIKTSDSSLAANSSVTFAVNNSIISVADLVIVKKLYDAVSPENYRVECAGGGSGAFLIRITNITGSPLSDVIVLHFAIIKGAIA